MKYNEILLNFKSLTDISGNPYGREIYKEQIKDNVDWSRINKIIFPNNIETVSISFVQGLMAAIFEECPNEILNKYPNNKAYFLDNFILYSEHEYLRESLINSVKF